MQDITARAVWLIAVSAALLSTVAEVTAQCPQAGNWTERADSCYKWFISPNYWYEAEHTCRSHGGHLVSIGSQQENRLVGRLSNCTEAWIGRFGTNLNRLDDPRSYSWTDGSDGSRFQRHNFSQLDSVHKPLIRTDGEWWLNSLYHERHPFVCELSSNSGHVNASARCPHGWSLFRRHCYLIPQHEANFNEANFYCQRKASQLVSVLSEAELHNINSLDLGSDSCEASLGTVWIGLIKLNPCFPDSGGRELCYQWTDFSGKHLGFPSWESGHPNTDDWTVNCVTLRGDRLQSDRCHSRHRFVCKAPAANDTDGGTETPRGVVAAFDFRKGLTNLVNPRTYPVFDDFGVPRNVEDGACFGNNSWYYRIGDKVRVNETIMAEKQWTMFYRVKYSHRGYVRIYPIVITENIISYINGSLLWEHPTLMVQSHHWSQSNTEMSIYHMKINDSGTEYYLSANSSDLGGWNDYAISFDDLQPELTVNQEKSSPYHKSSWNQPAPDNSIRQNLVFGNLNPDPYYRPESYYARCFGLANKRLSQEELRKVFSDYCH